MKKNAENTDKLETNEDVDEFGSINSENTKPEGQKFL